MIWVSREAEYFCGRDWTGQISLKLLEKIVHWRSGQGRKFGMADCISGWKMLHKQTAVIPDIATDARIPVHIYRDTFVRAW